MSELRDQHNIAVVAGHYMLMYDDTADALVPMVYQDSTNPRVTAFSKEMAGNFPVSSFKHGVGLTKQLQAKSKFARVALIVNDHSFLTNGWKAQNLTNSHDSLHLRRAYYRGISPIPRSFHSILADHEITLDNTLIDNNLPTRKSTDTVPRTSWLFSEHLLRRRFQQKTSHKLRAITGFTVIKNGTAQELHFHDPLNSNLVCLSDEEGCGCSGEIVEFLLLLAQKGMDSAVFYLPSECSEASHVGFISFLHSTPEIRKKLNKIIVVDGFGGMAHSDSKGNGYLTTSYIYQ